MLPQSQPRKAKNSSKVNLIISFVFHAVLVVLLLYFAAREGLLGKHLNKIAVEMVKKEKPPEKPKEPPKVEPPKVEPPKVVETPKIVEAPKVQAPPSTAPVVAPANNTLPAFDFGGGKMVDTSSDPVQLYKGFMEYTLRSQWNCPDDADNGSNFVTLVSISVDKQGNLSDPVFKSSSGDDAWNKTVQDVLKIVTNIGRPPPTNFPPRITVRFDMQEEAVPLLQ